MTHRSRVVSRLPNLLSGLRLSFVPLLLALAWHGESGLFLALFAVGLITDILDGVLARRLHVETEFGARLDQWADFALWVAFPIGAWWLWPGIVRRESLYVVAAMACLLLPTAIATLKYREVPGYHTYSAKLSSVLMGAAVPLLLIFDVSWPFRVATLFLLVAALDELGITWILPRCHHDVPSAFHAARMRREEASKP